MIPPTRYAHRDGVDLAYKVFGDGERDIVISFAFISHVDVFCELAEHMEFIERLMALGRVVIFDKRGTGLSDRTSGLSTIEQHADDLVAVLDAVGSRRAVVIGWFNGGAIGLVAAARHPDRIESVIAFEVLAVGTPRSDFPWSADAAWIASLTRGLDTTRWGGGTMAEQIWTTEREGRFIAWWKRYESMSVTPSGAGRLAEEVAGVDIRPYLDGVPAPVLVLHDPSFAGVDIGAMRWLADHLPNARLKLVRRQAATPPLIPTEDLVDDMEEFLIGTRSGGQRQVLTVVFTDIVGSTAELARVGDEHWRNALSTHGDELRRSLARYSGTEANTTGDGFVATFPLPSSALQFADEVVADAAGIGLTLRVGVNAGEVITRDGGLIGVAVHAAARICALAEPGRTYLSDTVRGLLVGSGFVFEDQGEHELRGVPGRWRLWCLARTESDV
ncbi:alpha/beta fold hydrolase [Agromyces sp. NPDC056523]|uniref:adenylate/guanylate cyclase domain-containing protein n=1 Tax=Agromyces sp. NPDC056523 TaxID=3345850 RepID=UPI00366CC047